MPRALNFSTGRHRPKTAGLVPAQSSSPNTLSRKPLIPKTLSGSLKSRSRSQRGRGAGQKPGERGSVPPAQGAVHGGAGAGAGGAQGAEPGAAPAPAAAVPPGGARGGYRRPAPAAAVTSDGGGRGRFKVSEACEADGATYFNVERHGVRGEMTGQGPQGRKLGCRDVITIFGPNAANNNAPTAALYVAWPVFM